jgi:hypothetical protein
MPNLTLKVKKGGGSFHNKVRELVKADKSSVEVGHFKEQGSHSSIGKSYVSLMKQHHNGGSTSKFIVSPPRPVITILDGLRVEPLLKSFKKEAESLITFNFSAEQILSSLGRRLVKEEKSIFGKSGLLVKNHRRTISSKGGKDTPLVDSGELQSKVAYKTSTGNKVVES